MGDTSPIASAGGTAPLLELANGEPADAFQFFELVHIADIGQQMMEVFYENEVRKYVDERYCRLAQHFSDFLSEISTERKAFTLLLDDLVAGGMDRSIQVLVNQVDEVLVRESDPEDYDPHAFKLDVRPSSACVAALSLIDDHTRVLSDVADKHTLDVFYKEISLRTFEYIPSFLIL